MKDRKIISAQFYRDEVQKRLDYVFPDDMEQQILDEEMRQLELMQQFKDPPQNEEENNPQQIGPGGRKEGAGDTISRRQRSRSNNTSRTNESNGTETSS